MKNSFSLLIALGVSLSACGRVPTSQPNIIDTSLQDLDLTSQGSFEVTVRDYALPPTRNDGIVDGRGITQVAGRAYAPVRDAAAPVLVFLHGNHPTCGFWGSNMDPATDPRVDMDTTFTDTGSCPEGMVPVPNHLGYEYVARHLASRGFFVISIDANRGITGINNSDDSNWSMVIPRGRLVLRHLELLNEWNSKGDSGNLLSGLPVKGRLNLSQVGMMGHSRGGEGVRVAYNMYHGRSPAIYRWKTTKPQIGFRGIFEIGPIDYGSDNGAIMYEAHDVPWSVLIPGCDGDVSNYMGVNPYRRMVMRPGSVPRSVIAVWGANHNFFNTEWQISDSARCRGSQAPLWDASAAPIPMPEEMDDEESWNAYPPLRGIKGSEAQRTIGTFLMTAFFEANVSGSNPQYNHVFDPQFSLPAKIASLAPMSREFSVRNNSFPIRTLNLTDTVAGSEGVTFETYDTAMDQRWPFYSQSVQDSQPGEENIERYTATATDAVVASWSRTQDGTVPFVDFDLTRAGDLTPYRFIDLVANRFDECNYMPADHVCHTYDAELDFSLQLVARDGTLSQSVRVSDYAKLRTYRDSLYGIFYIEPGNVGTLPTVYLEASELLLHTIPFEFADFRTAQGEAFPLADVARLRLAFDRSRAGSLTLEQVLLVTQR